MSHFFCPRLYIYKYTHKIVRLMPSFPTPVKNNFEKMKKSIIIFLLSVFSYVIYNLKFQGILESLHSSLIELNFCMHRIFIHWNRIKDWERRNFNFWRTLATIIYCEGTVLIFDQLTVILLLVHLSLFCALKKNTCVVQTIILII